MLLLRDWWCWRRVLCVIRFAEKNEIFCWTSCLQVVKRCWWRRGINARSKDSVHIQLIFFSVESNIVQIRHLIPDVVPIWDTCPWKYFNPQFMCSLLLFRLRVTRSRARWLFKKSCLWDNNKLQAVRGFGNLLPFPGRDLSQSGYLNLVQGRETLQYNLWKLRNTCRFTAYWKC